MVKGSGKSKRRKFRRRRAHNSPSQYVSMKISAESYFSAHDSMRPSLQNQYPLTEPHHTGNPHRLSFLGFELRTQRNACVSRFGSTHFAGPTGLVPKFSMTLQRVDGFAEESACRLIV